MRGCGVGEGGRHVADLIPTQDTAEIGGHGYAPHTVAPVASFLTKTANELEAALDENFPHSLNLIFLVPAGSTNTPELALPPDRALNPSAVWPPFFTTFAVPVHAQPAPVQSPSGDDAKSKSIAVCVPVAAFVVGRLVAVTRENVSHVMGCTLRDSMIS